VKCIKICIRLKKTTLKHKAKNFWKILENIGGGGGLENIERVEWKEEKKKEEEKEEKKEKEDNVSSNMIIGFHLKHVSWCWGGEGVVANSLLMNCLHYITHYTNMNRVKLTAMFPSNRPSPFILLTPWSSLPRARFFTSQQY